MKQILGLSLFFFGGCAALQSAQTGASTATSTKQQGDDLVGQGKDAVGSLKGKKGEKGGDKDGNDDDRLHAHDAVINTPLDDEVDPKKQDDFDWRKFVLSGKPGIATFEVHWDNEAANLDIDIYDAFGTNIARSPRKIEGVSAKKILVRIAEPGLYYVRISAPSAKDASIYTLSVKWKGPAAPPPSETPAAPPAVAAGAPPPPPPDPNAVDPNKVIGKIVTAYRDGSDWVLYLDKGSSDKLKVGLSGVVLEGADGVKPVEGGTFSISQVLEGHKSIARAQLKSPLGKNNRVMVTLK